MSYSRQLATIIESDVRALAVFNLATRAWALDFAPCVAPLPLFAHRSHVCDLRRWRVHWKVSQEAESLLVETKEAASQDKHVSHRKTSSEAADWSQHFCRYRLSHSSLFLVLMSRECSYSLVNFRVPASNRDFKCDTSCTSTQFCLHHFCSRWSWLHSRFFCPRQ